MATQNRAIRTRRAILEAAATVFSEHGYAAAKVADILELAEVTKGALYFHFDSKEELARAVIDAQAADAPPRAAQALRTQEFVDLGMVFAHRLTHSVLLRGSLRLTGESGECELNRPSPYRDWTRQGTALLEEAAGQGELLPGTDPAETAGLVVASYAGVHMMARALDELHDLERRMSALYRHVMPGVAVPRVLAALDMAPGRGARVLAAAAGG
ncbi:ScbR family autoregulator-binding transcription factor [Streptomyces orinoci]|uniref:ScbR family autoregulator-binding transcription factor n=1 Tax=Streptomyces orinoci TaxID=67339 RepID=A0ABV3JS50_STRON|nr:ScbR family autoregulator-binding transcription factor [Streptomyces orinoci]